MVVEQCSETHRSIGERYIAAMVRRVAKRPFRRCDGKRAAMGLNKRGASAQGAF
jgi:hypothetical protein